MGMTPNDLLLFIVLILTGAVLGWHLWDKLKGRSSPSAPAPTPEGENAEASTETPTQPEERGGTRQQDTVTPRLQQLGADIAQLSGIVSEQSVRLLGSVTGTAESISAEVTALQALVVESSSQSSEDSGEMQQQILQGVQFIARNLEKKQGQKEPFDESIFEVGPAEATEE